MRLSLNWLQDYIDTSDLRPEELADKLDLTGTAVENVFEEGAGLEKVVVGLIKKINPHPQAERLVLCEVYNGIETLPIVCGAKNMKEGDKVALTLPGARLPNGIQIKKTVIRGQESRGMLASSVELGLGEEASGHAYPVRPAGGRQAGIMILDPKLEPGERLDVALGLQDTVLELEITPNRPDEMSMIGMAREIGAVLRRDYKIPSVEVRGERREVSKSVLDLAEVEVLDTKLCPRYIAKIITDVTVGESPDWMKQRLIAAGARPINNLVDITNYVLFETGQPLHAFDYELLEGGQIIVRRAKAGEKITTLDDIERPLNNEHLVISDNKGAVALAGVMGGANSEVSDKTKTVLLESAYFDPYNIGQTSRSLGLISESSIRFERAIDPNNTAYAADRAAQLMQELAGAHVLKGSIDIYPKPFKLRKLKLRPKRANSILGIDIPEQKMQETLVSLELEAVLNPFTPPLNKGGQDKFVPPFSKEESSPLLQRGDRGDLLGGIIEVGVPTFRPDLEREIDLIEEIGRLHGLNSIESTLPGVAQVGRVTDMDLLQTKLRGLLTGAGLKEAITYSFIDPTALNDLPSKQQKGVLLSNPLSIEQSVLRTALLPGLMNSLKYNVARQQAEVQLFEMGAIFNPKNGFAEEKRDLGLILSGSKIDFFNAKGLVESVLQALLISEELVLQPFKHKLFNPQKSFEIFIGETGLGYLGELHPAVVQENDLQTTAYAELDLDILLEYQNTIAPFKGISAYPAITLDVALLLDKGVKNSEVVRSIEEMGHDLLTDIKLFDIYEGKGIEEGKKSMAYSLTYQSMERTLELEEAQKIHNSILDNLKRDLNASIR